MPDVSSLDQQYVELLKQRNELIKQLNASLKAQVNEAQGRVDIGVSRIGEIRPPTIPAPSAPLDETKSSEPNDDSIANTSIDKGNQHIDKNHKLEKSGNEGIPEEKHFCVVVNKWNSDTQKWEDSEYESAKDSDVNKRRITYRRMMDITNEKKVYHEECNIPLQGLIYLLRDNMTHVEREWFETEPIMFDSPFANIVYNWPYLEKASLPQETDDDELRESRYDLKLLLENIRNSEPRKLRAYFKERESLLRAGTITFGTLWTLFQPGTKVLAKPFMDEWQMFEVQTNWGYYTPSDVDRDDTSGYDQHRLFYLYCAGFDWDGKHFRRYTYQFTFEKFEGRRLINGLQCFPIEYWSAENSRGVELSKLKGRLIERGKKFARLCTAKKEDYLCKYSGFLLHVLPPTVKLSASSY